jgi:adenosine deaminase
LFRHLPDVERRDLRGHTLRRFRALGASCTVNADDPLIIDVDLVDEYKTCRNALGLDHGQSAARARTSFEYSGVIEDLKWGGLAGGAVWLGSPVPA